MSTPNAAKLAQQILTVSTLCKFPFTGGNLPVLSEAANVLAGYLDGAGTTDIRNLRQYVNAAQNLQFVFDIASGHVFPGSNAWAGGGGVSQSVLTYSNSGPVQSEGGGQNGPIVAQSVGATNLFFGAASPTISKYWYVYYLNFTADAFPVFYCDVQYQSSDWVVWRGGLEFLASTVVSAFAPAIGQYIGAAVLGADTAAAYPALATAVGNVAVNTALDGGNVKQALVSSLGGSAGLAVGVQITPVTCQAIGSAAAAAVTALITGGNPGTATLTSLLKSGITGAVNPPIEASAPIVSTTGVPAMSLSDPTFSLSDPNASYLDPSLSSPMYSTPITTADPTLGPTSTPAGSSLPSVLNTPPNPFDFSSSSSPLSPPSSASTPATGSQDPLSAAASGIISSLAAGVLRTILPGALLSSPTASQTVNANGTITTRNTNGTVSTTQIPAGTAYPLPNGGSVVNNGNGTYTTIAANGVQTTTSYASAGMSSNTLLLLAGVGLLAVMMRK